VSLVLRKRGQELLGGISSATWWRLQRTPGFPRPFRVSRQLLAWDEEELRAWVAQRRVQRPVPVPGGAE
jgi:predicted DNA-binding transcriptional regulator AlpA